MRYKAFKMLKSGPGNQAWAQGPRAALGEEAVLYKVLIYGILLIGRLLWKNVYCTENNWTKKLLMETYLFIMN